MLSLTIGRLLTGRIAVLTAVAAFAAALGAVHPPQASASGLSCWVQGAYLGSSGSLRDNAWNGRYFHKAVCNLPHRAKVALFRNGIYVHEYSTGSSQTSGGHVTGSSDPFFWMRYALFCGSQYQVKVWIDNTMNGPGDDLFFSSGAPRYLC